MDCVECEGVYIYALEIPTRDKFSCQECAMLHAEFRCELCDFETNTFVTGYIPEIPYHLIFQDERTFEFRIVFCEMPPNEKVRRMSNSDFEQMIAALVAENRRPGETWLDDIDYVRNRTMRLHCPKCRELAVSFKALGII